MTLIPTVVVPVLVLVLVPLLAVHAVLSVSVQLAAPPLSTLSTDRDHGSNRTASLSGSKRPRMRPIAAAGTL